MNLDRYSKVVLTVLAAGLVAVAVGQFKPGPASAQSVPGMTLRDWFAGQYLNGLQSRGAIPGDAATLSYRWADAMLAAR